jgi:hypothetical protein
VPNQPWLNLLRGKIVILSACEVGADHEAMHSLIAQNRLDLLLAYGDAVYDGLAFAAEALVYDRLLDQWTSPPEQLKKSIGRLAAFLHQERYDYTHPEDRLPKSLRSSGPLLKVLTRTRRVVRSDAG